MASAPSGVGATVTCGVSGKTVWILDPGDSPATINHDYVPVINGSDTNFSHPFVMTYPKNGHPTDTPRPQVFVQNLAGFSHGPGDPIGSVQDNQLWALTGRAPLGDAELST